MPAWGTSACWSAASFQKPTFPSCWSWAWRECLDPARRCRRLPNSSAPAGAARMLDDLLKRLRTGDRQALSRLLSVVGRGEQLGEIRAAITTRPANSLVVAVTGNAGVGKSTLVGKLAEYLRSQDKT